MVKHWVTSLSWEIMFNHSQALLAVSYSSHQEKQPAGLSVNIQLWRNHWPRASLLAGPGLASAAFPIYWESLCIAYVQIKTENLLVCITQH